MLQVPNNPKKKSASGYYRPAANLKRDINLLPTNDNPEKIARIGFYLIGTIIFAALLVYVAILLPSMQLQASQVQGNALSVQATNEAPISVQFDSDVAEREKLQSVKNELGIMITKDQPSDLVSQISNACPDTITVISITLSPDGAMIDGYAPDDGVIAQFITNLKTIPAYQDVRLSTIQDYKTGIGPNQKRQFEVVTLYPLPPSPSPSPVPTPTATQEGGN